MPNEEVITKLVTPSGKTVVLKGDSMSEAGSNSKGAIAKKADSVITIPEQNSEENNSEATINGIVRAMRAAGIVSHDKFRLIYDMNGQDVDFDGVGDENVYTAGQTATIPFASNSKIVPYREGYIFHGYSLNKTDEVPTYEYDDKNPQDYTVTFANDDIVLYAIWEEEEAHVYTIYYSLGSEGTGSVPQNQEVEEGESVELSFSPAPTCTEQGRVFVGWTTQEKSTSEYNDAEYREDGNNTIDSVYSDIVLYPVFCAQRTLTYALGNDGTGSVPNGGTFYNGQYANISFHPAPTCVSDPSKSFIGWAYQDEQSSASFPSSMMIGTVQMNSDITLYPVFASAPAAPVLTYALGDYATGSVPDPKTATQMGMVYYAAVDFSPAPTCTRAGTWRFVGWSAQDDQSSPAYAPGLNTQIYLSSNMTLYPVFVEETTPDGTVTVDATGCSSGVVVYKDGSYYDYADNTNSKTIDFSEGVQMDFVCNGADSATFTGTYNGQSYTNAPLSKTTSHYGAVFLNPEDDSQWTFASGDSGTIIFIGVK